MRRGVLAVVLVLLTVPASAGAQEEASTLRLALVIPVTSQPFFSSDGKPAADVDARLESLTGAIDSLRALDDVAFALALSPVFCDELRLLGQRSVRIRSILTELAARTPFLTAPYAEVRLPELPSSEAVRKELVEGRTRSESCGRVNGALLAPPDLAIDTNSLAGAAAARVRIALAPAERVRGGPTRTGEVTLVPAARLPASDAPNDAFIHFAQWDAAAAIVAPDRPDLSTLIRALANDPRIEITDLSDLAADPVTRFVPLPESRLPSAAYRRATERAETALNRLRSYTLPGNHMTDVFATAVARARSSAEWNGRWSVGVRRARGVVRTLQREEQLITATEGSVTFTSRRGSVPVTVSNAASYTVRLRIRLSTTKLEFPDGSTRIVSVDPPGDTVIFNALARSTGAFPVHVRITSPNGAIRFHSGELTVRSTAANVPALALTAGGAIFLVAWYARLIARRRRERGAPR